MRWKFSLCIFLFLLLADLNGRSADIRIRLFYPNLIKSLMMNCSNGSYSMTCMDINDMSINSGDNIFIRAYEHKLWMRYKDGGWLQVQDVILSPVTERSTLTFKPADPVLEDREYLGKFSVKLTDGNIELINIIDLEKYIMGVVLAEAGPAVPDGYYKVQAIICRTYAIRNLEKHAAEGFNLCDNVHCQVYKGMHRWNENIEIAVEATEGLIITDADSVPAITAFHSNSGGETQGAEKAWLTSVPYLKAVLDPFSIGQPNERWEMTIGADKWLDYLKKNGFVIPKKPDYKRFEITQQHRATYYQVGDHKIELRKIREDWNLKSTFFSIVYNDGSFIFKGKGYGHGVGLSQEGAINMARKGYHYSDILNFYYYNIHIIDYRLLKIPGLN
jgi:stage II sporulation protein D (peptidoglycan lytic transglycosylase)